MKSTAALICLLLLLVVAAPGSAADDDLSLTDDIIHGVTLDPTDEPGPTEEPTEFPTEEPTELPTEEPTEEPTFTILPVTETPYRPVTAPTTEEIVTITAPPEPQVGWLTVLSTPSGADVFIDGNPAGVTPVTGRELGAGSHTVRITIAGYQPYLTGSDVRAGEQASVDATLTPIWVTTVPTTPVTAPPTLPPTPCVGCDKGWIRVFCNVDGATVSFDDLSSGCTISGGSCDTQVTVTGTPFRTFSVQKPGYQIFTGPVTTWPGKGQTVSLSATLNPDPAPVYGDIRVTSNPSGAVVTLDGGSRQYTPATFTSVRAGTSHFIQVSMSGYQPYGTSVYVTGGQTSSVNAYLVPNPPYPTTGSLNVVTSPGGADIYVDGNYVAESPFLVTGLSPGSHILRLHKAGYDEYFSSVTIQSGRQTPFSYTFTTQPGSVGSISVISIPSGAFLYLDGNYMGQTSGASFDLTSIVPGYHTILLRLADYRDYSQTVSVKGGQVVTVTAQLTPNAPSPVPDTTGQIMIVSTPSGAELYLDNTYRGITPATLSDIPAGSHVVMVREPGYTDASQTVTVTGGQSTPVALSLAKVPVTTLAPLSVLPVLGAVALTGMILVLGRRKK